MSKHKYSDVAKSYAPKISFFNASEYAGYQRGFLDGCDHVESLNNEVASKTFEEWWDSDKDIPEILGRASETVKAVTNMSERCSRLSEFWAQEAFQAALEIGRKLERDKQSEVIDEIKKDLRWAIATCWNASQLISDDDEDGECEEVFERVKHIKEKYFKEEERKI